MTESRDDLNDFMQDYVRPNQSWLCGRLCDGKPCQLGPTSKGHCTLQSTCSPERRGDRFVCTRQKLHGGPCEQGPLPDGSCPEVDLTCQPVRTVLSKRKIATAWVFSLALSICLIGFGANKPTLFMSPGEVSDHHTTFKHDCARCHAAADGGLGFWFQCAANELTSLEDSKRCLECHSDLGSDPLRPHSCDVSLLSAMEKQAEKRHSTGSSAWLTASKSVPNLAMNKNHEIACATCHHEHHGKQSDLTRITDLQCQSCHSQTFHSFEVGHPEFERYPHQARTPIYFDHARHLQQYFVADEFRTLMPEGIPRTTCVSCHIPDAQQTHMQVRSYEQMCGSCHESQIRDRAFPGIPLLAFPAIQATANGEEAVPDALSSFGHWPQQATTSLSQLPPLMKRLLQSDKEFIQAAESLGSFDLRTISLIQQNQPEAVSAYLWGIKRLVNDVQTNGKEALKQRLGNDSPLVVELGDELTESIIAVGRHWFPDVSAEVRANREGTELSAPKLANDTSIMKNRPIPAGRGWSLHSDDLTVRYHPSGHADPLLKSLLDLSVTVQSHEDLSESDEDEEAIFRQELFRLLAGPVGSGSSETRGPLANGRCMVCHSTSDNEAGSRKIHWGGHQVHHEARPITKFAHSPHLLIFKKEGCKACHELELDRVENALYRKSYFQREEETGRWKSQNLSWATDANHSIDNGSGFRHITKATCATCHNQRSVGQQCVFCHNYHVTHLRN